MVMPWLSVALGLAGARCFPRLPATIRTQRPQEIRDHGVAGRRHRHVHGRERLVFHVRAGMQGLIERRRDDPGGDWSGAPRLPQRATQVDPIQRQNDICLADQLACRLGKNIEGRHVMRGMIGRKHRALLEIGDHAGTDLLGEPDARLPELRLARPAPEHDHRPLGVREQRRRPIDGALPRPRRLGRQEAGYVRPLRLLLQSGFLQSGVQANVDRRRWFRARGDIGAAHGLHQRLRRGRLVVPFDDRADIGALVARCVDPVDPGTALFGIERTGRTDHDHGDAVAPGVEQAHHAVQEPDIAVQDASHGLAGRLGITVRDRNRMVLVKAEQDARPLVAEMIDDAVV
jgi:hypothetical protein